jgi:SAM-dependent methyltransferase
VRARREDRSAGALLGDTPARDYAAKLRLFSAFAEPELRLAIRSLDLAAGMRVLDAGCGTGEALVWLSEAVAPGGLVTGIDLAQAHVAAARGHAGERARVLQADLLNAPFAPASFELIWCVNTLNHLADPLAGARALASLLRSGGRLVLAQSSFLPDMYFAWDARLERLANEAVRAYYRDRYHLSEEDLTAVRALLGVARRAGLREVSARTLVLERTAPLGAADEAYLREAIFRDSWGERLRPYLPAAEFARLERLCDPAEGEYALRRVDFHFLQTLTLVVASV